MSLRLLKPAMKRSYFAFLDDLRKETGIDATHEMDGCLLLLHHNHQATLHPIAVLEIIAPVAYMTRVARIFAKHEMIGPGRTLRMMVDEVYHFESAWMLTWPGYMKYPQRF